MTRLPEDIVRYIKGSFLLTDVDEAHKKYIRQQCVEKYINGKYDDEEVIALFAFHDNYSKSINEKLLKKASDQHHFKIMKSFISKSESIDNDLTYLILMNNPSLFDLIKDRLTLDNIKSTIARISRNYELLFNWRGKNGEWLNLNEVIERPWIFIPLELILSWRGPNNEKVEINSKIILHYIFKDDISPLLDLYKETNKTICLKKDQLNIRNEIGFTKWFVKNIKLCFNRDDVVLIKDYSSLAEDIIIGMINHYSNHNVVYYHKELIQKLLKYFLDWKGGKIVFSEIILMRCYNEVFNFAILQEIILRNNCIDPTPLFIEICKDNSCNCDKLKFLLEWRGRNGEWIDLRKYKIRDYCLRQLSKEWRGPNGERIGNNSCAIQ